MIKLKRQFTDRFIIVYFQMQQVRQSFRETHLFSDVALQSCGFEVASQRKRNRQLYRIIPSGRKSALFTAIIESLNSIRSLNIMIEESGTSSHWRLALIVIVSSHDSASSMDYNEVKRTYFETKRRLNVEQLKIVFVAYNVDRQVYEQLEFLQGLDELGITTLHFATSQQKEDGYESFGKLMQRIRDNLGMNRSHKDNRGQDHQIVQGKVNPSIASESYKNPYIAQPKNFGVLFTISAAQRYRGEAWTSLCHGVQAFSKYLGQEDLFGCILFTQCCSFYSGNRFESRQWGAPAPLQNNSRPQPPLVGNELNAPLLANQPYIRPAPVIINQQNAPRSSACRICCICLSLLVTFIIIPLIVTSN